jgi:hypothetical protein
VNRERSFKPKPKPSPDIITATKKSAAIGMPITALGGLALFSDTTGQANTPVGLNALRFNTIGLRLAS